MNILSVQSHVAFGHVGNSAAVFPLQRLGFEVWPVHTVQLSNHPGYGDCAGHALAAKHVKEVVAGLIARDVLTGCDAVLSGYLGQAETAQAIEDAVTALKGANPTALYLCDPVMGDQDCGLYVDREIPGRFREQLVPRADIITPNLFELETLSGAKVTTLPEAIEAARRAQTLGPRIVLVTSLRHATTRAGEIELLAVTAEGAWRLCTPLLPCEPQPNGAGDLVASLFLGCFLQSRDLVPALEQTAAATFAVLAATQAAGTRELQLITAQDELLQPPRRFKTERLD